MANFIFQVVKLSETGTKTTFSWNQRQISPHSKRTLFWAKSIHMTKSASKLTAWHARTKTDYFYYKNSPVINLSPHSQPFSPFCPFPSSPLPPHQLLATQDYSLSCPWFGLSWDGTRPWVPFTSQRTFPQAWEPVRFKYPKHSTLLLMHALTTCSTHHLFYNHNSLDQDLFPMQSSAPFSVRLWVLLVCSCVWRWDWLRLLVMRLSG